MLTECASRFEWTWDRAIVYLCTVSEILLYMKVNINRLHVTMRPISIRSLVV